MFGSAILDVAIGLIFVFLMVSLMVTALTELLAGWRKWRATTLWAGLVNLLDDPGTSEWTARLYAHPLIQGMSPPPKKEPAGPAGGKNGPSYIPPRTFALALLDTVRERTRRDLAAAVAQLGDPAAKETSAAIANLPKVAGLAEEMASLLERARAAGYGAAQLQQAAAGLVAALPDEALLQAGVAHLRSSRLGRSLAVLHEEAAGDAERLKTAVADWFNNGMDRVSGWYKRHTQFVHVLLATGLTLGINVDSIAIVQHLATDTAMRSAVVAEAQGFARQGNPSDPTFQTLETELQKLDLPVGWTLGTGKPVPDPSYRTIYTWSDLLPAARYHFWGWLLTAIAASLGAPFWFDMLNKVITIRAAGKAPDEARPAQATPTATVAILASPATSAAPPAG
jgi:hypothetical protein